MTSIIAIRCPQNDLKPSNNQSEVQVVCYLDADRDNMWDDWETFYQLNPNDPLDAFADADGDKLTNLQEFLAGTDPRDPSSFLRISSASCIGTNFQIQFWAVPDKQYLLERTDSLRPPNWTSVTNFILGTTMEVQLTEPIPPNTPARFYRISVVPNTTP